MNTFIAYYSSPIGLLELIADQDSLLRINRTDKSGEVLSSADHPIIRQTVKELDEYFAGKRSGFDVPVRFLGTDFQNQVWNALLQIPYGETTTYSRIAQLVGRPKAVRAVGTAIGRNPVPLIVPCHRVVASDGGLAGFAWGLDAKKYLLRQEGIGV